METFINMLPALLPIILPPLIAFGRNALAAFIPPHLIPLALGVGGALVGGVASLLGTDLNDLAGASADAWDGALIGLATVGVHQAWTKTRAGA